MNILSYEQNIDLMNFLGYQPLDTKLPYDQRNHAGYKVINGNVVWLGIPYRFNNNQYDWAFTIFEPLINDNHAWLLAEKMARLGYPIQICFMVEDDGSRLFEVRLHERPLTALFGSDWRKLVIDLAFTVARVVKAENDQKANLL
jgi:hypothetical protein